MGFARWTKVCETTAATKRCSVLAGASAPLYTPIHNVQGECVRYDLIVAREFVRMNSSSFLVRPSFEIQVHLQIAFLLNRDPREARPCDKQNDNMRSSYR